VPQVEQAQQRMMLETVEKFAREVIGLRAAEIDVEDAFPRDIYEALGELGLFGIFVPEEYGGTAVDLKTKMLLIDRIARASGACALIFANCGDATEPIVRGGTEAIKERYLPGIAAGTLIPCFALTEPEAGSDAAGITSRAVRTPDGWSLSGQKVFCTNGSVGDVYVVFAKTPEAGTANGRNADISAFVVPRDAEGFSIGRDEDMLGLRGSPATELVFDDVRLPDDHLLGEAGGGFALAMGALNEARLNASVISLAIARSAVQLATDYARDRRQFGRPIIQHQGVAFLLAEAAAELSGAWFLIGHAIDAMENGEARAAGTQVAMAKLLSTDAAMRAAVNAVQVLGGYGLAREFVVERLMRDVKAFQIFDGTNQIQKLIIGRHLERHGVPIADTW
jgi:alkylation response protein AidB-like acyl-CoA dehydrogenase